MFSVSAVTNQGLKEVFNKVSVMLKDIPEEEKTKEKELEEKQNDVDIENTQLATQIEAIDASIESFEGMRDEALQDGYFD